MSRRKWSLLIGLIGSVMFNVGWWISGSRDERRENVDENKEKSPPEAGTESSAYEWRARKDVYCNIPRLPEARSAAN